MADDLQDMIEQLKLERGILRDGGYGRSVRTPTKAERLFRDSVTCLNVGQEVQRHPCTDCLPLKLYLHPPTSRCKRSAKDLML